MGETLIGLAGVVKGLAMTATLQNRLVHQDIMRKDELAELELAASFIENLRRDPAPEGEPVAGMFAAKSTPVNLESGFAIFARGTTIDDPRLIADLRVAGVDLLPVYENELEALAQRLHSTSSPMQPAIGPMPHRDKKGKVRVPIAWIVLKDVTLSTDGGYFQFRNYARIDDPSLARELIAAGVPLETVFA